MNNTTKKGSLFICCIVERVHPFDEFFFHEMNNTTKKGSLFICCIVERVHPFDEFFFLEPQINFFVSRVNGITSVHDVPSHIIGTTGPEPICFTSDGKKGFSFKSP